MPEDVRVRAETPMLGLAWGQVVTVSRTPLVEAAIAEKRLTVLDGDGAPAPLRGELLEQALRERELPTGGTADEKRARVLAYDVEQAALAASAGTPPPNPPRPQDG